MDRAWWREYGDEVDGVFGGLRVTSVNRVPGVKHVKIRKCRHSGEGAISLAAHFGAVRVGLIGYDCQHTDGKKHWHGDHPQKLGNAATVHRWVGHLSELARDLNGVEVLNMSRQTAIKHWPRISLQQFIEGSL